MPMNFQIVLHMKRMKMISPSSYTYCLIFFLRKLFSFFHDLAKCAFKAGFEIVKYPSPAQYSVKHPVSIA